ncbi:hypothetical protein SESBI_37110 [Sesbania bispinosa]|nr:hypothetical protein SESBI_37110 [Sesbania bispinosa]
MVRGGRVKYLAPMTFLLLISPHLDQELPLSFLAGKMPAYFPCMLVFFNRDWYNLEKSKRVKPFRCGEFDACIERAESSQGMPLKKREKYARREDAILHALELERQMLKKQEKLGAGQMGAAFRAKRSKCVYLPAESSDSLDYKETLTNVPMSSSQPGGEYPHCSSLAEESESAFIDDVESDSSETGSTNSDSDSSETELDKDEEMTILSETGHDAEEQESTSSEEPDELAISSEMPHLYLREPITYVEGQRSHLNHTRLGPSLHYDRNYSDVLDDSDQMFRLEDEYLTSRAVAKGQNKTRLGVDWDEWAWEDQPASRGYWDSKGFAPLYSDRYHFHGRKRSMLVDVDLKVQAIDDLSNDGIGFDGSSVLPPAWRTARRTANFRVPRPHILSSSSAEIAADFSLDQERNIEYKKLNGGSSSHKANLSRKNGLDSLGPSIDKKSFKKMPKKVSLISSQKTRTLSSLSIEHNLSKRPSLDRSFYQTDRLTKPEVSGLTTVACIPVKLVFSRLLEKINRPPLKAASNATLLDTGVERKS